MTTELEKIIEKIKDSVSDQMFVWKVDRFNWIKKVEKYCKHTVYKEFGYTHSHKLYAEKVKNGYSKSLERYFGRSVSNLKKMIKKDADHKILKIDVAVIKKLKGVTIDTAKLIYFNTNSKDGFCEGAWKINNEKIFSFETIYAGGYNVQCLHVRTIYKFK